MEFSSVDLELCRVTVLKYPASQLPHARAYNHSALLSCGGRVPFFFLPRVMKGGWLVTPHEIDGVCD
jgi:hypothetical protein